MAAAVPGSTLVNIPGVAHLSNMEAPLTFNSAVRLFLEKLR
jgi:pimeloyl-ACP methyl ester carboxylesterase